jgi:hypothetical protein
LRARGTNGLVAALLFALAMLLAPAPAFSAVPVTIPSDEQDGECTLDCSLRDAVIIAGRTGDTVQVPAGTYTLSIGQLNVGNVTIQGAGAEATAIQAGSNARVIQITGSATIRGVTITGGVDGFSGAGIQVGNNQVAMTLQLSDSAVSSNSATTGANGFGGGIMVNGLATLVMTNTTVSGNRVQGGDGTGAGAGIYVDGNARAELRNSTISSNIAELGSSPGLGGGIAFDTASTLVMENVTVAANTAGSGGGIAQDNGAATAIAISDTIVATNSGGDCSGAIAHSGDYNLSGDASCAFNAPGDKQNSNPLIGLLQVNTGGGRTATHALSLGSPAINAGDPSTCKPTDQRGALRPAGACDIGAFEYVAPRLTVTTAVTNNDGGEDGPGDFSVRVRDAAGTDVAGSPQAGSASGTTYTLVPGSFTVSADGPNLYTLAVGGACSAAGAVALGENQTATCTITADDRQPRAGREVGAFPASGTVRIKKPGGRFRVMREGDILPNGTIVDALKGRITLIAAANKRGKESKADFYGGIFKIGQNKKARPTTTLTLTEKLRCPTAGKATTAAKRKKKRRLWGDGSGKFRTKGKHSAATVVGTKWLVEDRCKSTLTRVVRGRVSVRDFVKKKTVIVRKGKRYIARADD